MGLGALVMAIFAGLTVSDLVAEREETVAVAAATVSATAAVLWPPARPSERLVLSLAEDGALALSPREREALLYLSQGLTTQQIGEAMGIAPGTARNLLSGPTPT